MGEIRRIGSVGVDAGILWIGDPFYIMGDEASNRVTDWKQFCAATFYKQNEIKNTHGVSAPLGPGTGFVVPTAYGDGVYDVFVEYDRNGNAKKLIVDLQ